MFLAWEKWFVNVNSCMGSDSSLIYCLRVLMRTCYESQKKDSFKPLVSSFTVQIWPIFKTIPTANQLKFIGNLIKWYLEVCTCTRDAAIHIRNRLATNDTDWPPDVVYLSDNAYKAQFHDNDDKHRSWPVSFTCHMHTLREN